MPTGVYVRKNDVKDRLRAGLAADHVEILPRGCDKDAIPTRRSSSGSGCLPAGRIGRARRLAFDTVRAAHAASFGLIDEGYRPRFRGDVNMTPLRRASCSSPISKIAAPAAYASAPEAPIIDEYRLGRGAAGAGGNDLGTYATAISPFVARSARIRRPMTPRRSGLRAEPRRRRIGRSPQGRRVPSALSCAS